MEENLEISVGMTIDDVKKLKKDCEAEISKIIGSFEKRTHIRVEAIDIEDRNSGFSTLSLNCKL